MVPQVNEVTRIQTGNPVPIGGSENARAAFEANEALGKAIFNLGNELDNVKEDTERFKIQAKIAADQYEMELIKQEQRERVNGAMDDPSGVGTAEKIFRDTSEFKGNVLNQIDPRARPYFAEYSTDVERRQLPNFLKTSVDGNQTRAKNEQNEMFAGISEKARLQPEMLPVRLLEVDVAVEESNMIPVSQKDGVAREKKAAVVKSVADQFKNTNNFGLAKRVLETHRPLFDNDKLDEELRAIDRQEIDYVNLGYTTMQRDIKASEELIKTQQDTAMKQYTTAQAKAGNNTAAQKMIDNQIMQDPRLDSNSKINLTKQKTTFAEIKDDEYQFKFIDKLITTGNFKTAEATLTRDLNKGVVSTDRAVKLQDFLKDMKERSQRDPNIALMIKQGLDEIKSYGKVSKQLDPITGMMIEYVDQANEKAQTMYTYAIARASQSGRQITPEFVNEQISVAIGKFGKARTTNIPGVNPTDVTSSQKVDDVLQGMAVQIQKDIKNGTATPEKIRKLREQKNQLLQQKKELQKVEGITITPSTNSKKNRPLFDE